MDVSTLFAPADRAENNLVERRAGKASDDFSELMVNLRMAMASAVADPGNPGAAEHFRQCRRRAAIAFSKLAKKSTNSTETADALVLVRDAGASGVHDAPSMDEDRKLAESLCTKGWPGLLGAMLLLPAWQFSHAPLLLNVPAWMRVDYVSWLFAAPQGFCTPGNADAYASHILQRLEELVRWVNREPGASAEAEVLGAYVAQNNCIPLYFSSGNLRRHAELRGRLLTRASVLTEFTGEMVAPPRGDRRLRVGFVNRHFGPQTETYTTIPSFEYLDAARFDVSLFCHRVGDTAAEVFCRQVGGNLALLPGDLAGQLEVLRSADLDVVVFGTNVTAVCNEVSLLALHRVAPLQVVNNSSCITSGLPQVDLYISGSLTETALTAADFSERLGLLPGPAHAFNYECDNQEARVASTRAGFKIPEDAFVFVSGANYFKIIPEMQETWARMLAAVPGSYLLLHPFNPNWSSSYPSQRFRADFSAVLQRHGVSPSRLAISTLRLPSRTDVKALLSLGNVYLDTFPFGGVNSLVDPLELGMPVVAWEGSVFRSRMGAALLRSLGLPHLVAQDAKEYHTIAVGLAQDPQRRQDLCSRIREKMEQAPLFLDRLAASEAMGDLLETAYDELADVGRAEFRKNSQPLVAKPSATGSDARSKLCGSPNDADARYAHAQELAKNGRSDRAIIYYLSALNGCENHPQLWLDLGAAFQATQQYTQAIEAVEAGLRLDAKRVGGWRQLAELARHFQAEDLASQADQMIRELGDPSPV